jgi:VCBS repeat-containing protein
MNTSSALKQATALVSGSIAVGVCFAAALFVVAGNVPAALGFGQVNVQGQWAYTARDRDDGIEYMATIQAVEDSAWLLLACSPDKRLTAHYRLLANRHGSAKEHRSEKLNTIS